MKNIIIEKVENRSNVVWLNCGNSQCTNRVKRHRSVIDSADIKMNNRAVFTCSDKCSRCEEVRLYRREAFKAKYGVTCLFKTPIVREKIKKTLIEKYGVDNCFKSEDIKKKLRNTHAKRYGCINPQQNENTKIKTRNTLIEKYGSYDKYRTAIIDQAKINNMKKYGVEWYSTLPEGRYTRQNLLKIYHHTEEEVDNIFKNRSCSLEYMIKRYGAEEGAKRYADWVSKITHNLENFKRRYGEEVGTQKFKEYQIKKIQCINRFSKIATEFCNKLIDYAELPIQDCKYAETNELFIHTGKQIYFYDFNYKDKIIEFNGDFWHANPEIYESFDLVKLPINPREAHIIWNADRIKLNAAIERGFKVYYVWERSYRSDPVDVVQKAKQFLLGE